MAWWTAQRRGCCHRHALFGRVCHRAVLGRLCRGRATPTLHLRLRCHLPCTRRHRRRDDPDDSNEEHDYLPRNHARDLTMGGTGPYPPSLAVSSPADVSAPHRPCTSALARPHASSRVRPSRMALPLLGPYGRRSSLHHGLLRVSLILPLPIPPHSKFVLFRTQIIMFSDLECDYINPIDLCNKLNQVRPSLSILHSRARPLTPSQFVLPENIAHAFLALLFLISGQWIAFLLNAPLLAYNINKCVPSPSPSTRHHLLTPNPSTNARLSLSGYAAETTCTMPQKYSAPSQTTRKSPSSSSASTSSASSTTSIGMSPLSHPLLPPSPLSIVRFFYLPYPHVPSRPSAGTPHLLHPSTYVTRARDLSLSDLSPRASIC